MGSGLAHPRRGAPGRQQRGSRRGHPPGHGEICARSCRGLQEGRHSRLLRESSARSRGRRPLPSARDALSLRARGKGALSLRHRRRRERRHRSRPLRRGDHEGHSGDVSQRPESQRRRQAGLGGLRGRGALGTFPGLDRLRGRMPPAGESRRVGGLADYGAEGVALEL